MSEDFDGDPSDRAGLSLACVLAASAARRGKSELVTTGAPVVTEEMYIKPSQAQVDYNANIVANPEGKQALVLQHLMASNLQAADLPVFAGSIDSADATKLACSLVEAFDDTDGVLRKDGKEFTGFHKYAEHIGSHDDNAQIASSVIFKQSFLKKLSNDVWSELYKVYNDVSSKVGNTFEIVAAHVLFSKNQSVCFEYHQDTRDHAKNVDLSVVVQLSASKSTFNVAGFDSFSYEHSGAFFAFLSCLWHRSGVACNDTIKIAFFFRLKDPADAKRALDDAINVEEAGSPSEPASKVVKTES